MPTLRNLTQVKSKSLVCLVWTGLTIYIQERKQKRLISSSISPCFLPTRITALHSLIRLFSNSSTLILHSLLGPASLSQLPVSTPLTLVPHSFVLRTHSWQTALWQNLATLAPSGAEKPQSPSLQHVGKSAHPCRCCVLTISTFPV